eukprot:m.385548 g.385548  ORF g.385548 m.385548 type:complete len:79 (+) comp138481_c0_seq1:27-263(+)
MSLDLVQRPSCVAVLLSWFIFNVFLGSRHSVNILGLDVVSGFTNTLIGLWMKRGASTVYLTAKITSTCVCHDCRLILF